MEQKAESQRIEQTEFLLKILDKSDVKIYQFNNTIKAIFHELQMTGNNLNQIAYLANCGYFHEAADKIPAFQKQYNSVMESLQSFIEKPIVDMYVVEAGEWHSEM